MKQLTRNQRQIVANKIHEYAEMLVHTNEPGKLGKIIAKIEMLSDMIADGYSSSYSGFESAYNTIIEI
nr:MAG TPA: hypothetical protein [Caudoviricetes sp.]